MDAISTGACRDLAARENDDAGSSTGFLHLVNPFVGVVVADCQEFDTLGFGNRKVVVGKLTPTFVAAQVVRRPLGAIGRFWPA